MGQHNAIPGNSQKSAVAAPADSIKHETGWWSVKFVRPWEEQPPWYLDAFIAHDFIHPVIEKFRGDIELWRFHRRSVDDDTGHRFTFHFYSTAEVAKKIYEEINENPHKALLIESPVYITISFTGLNQNIHRAIADTSDSRWPDEIRQGWPYFAMGVSQTWLKLIDEIVSKSSDFDSINMPLDEMLEHYRQANEVVEKMWENDGSHVFLHHLNALFGYKELYIYERRLKRF